MIEGLGPYPDVRGSGVAWLGDVPAHWEVRRLRTLAELRVSNIDKKEHAGELPVRLCNYVDVYKHDTIRAGLPFMAASASPAEIERFRIRVGDVLITKDSEDWQDIGVPAYVAEEADDLVCGYHLAILRPWDDKLVGRYLHWQLQGPHCRWQLSIAANGITRYGLDQDAIKSLVVAAPPAEEQAGIVGFLDHADRLIRRHVGAKQRLIRLLEEQKQAVVHRAVTRGLNPDAPRKPSGIPWLGDIPAHWELALLGRCLNRIEQGWSPVAAEGELRPEQWAVLSLSAVKKGRFDKDALKPIDLDATVPVALQVSRRPSSHQIEHEGTGG